MWPRLRAPHRGQAGVALVEVIVGIATFSILAVGIIALAVVGTRTAIESERRVVALQLATERMEIVRSLPYELIAYAPEGAVQQRQTVVRNQQSYDLEMLITPLNPSDDLAKTVQVTARWEGPTKRERNVQLVTYVSGVQVRGIVECALPPGSVSWNFQYGNNFADQSFNQCLSHCANDPNLLAGQCCSWYVAISASWTGLRPSFTSPVQADCSCAPPAPLPREATDHPVPGSDQYTKLFRECMDGTRCGYDGAGAAISGTTYCSAGCMQEAGDCLCECP